MSRMIAGLLLVIFLGGCGPADSGGHINVGVAGGDNGESSVNDWPEPVQPPSDLNEFPGNLQHGAIIESEWQRPRLAELRALNDDEVQSLLTRLESLPESKDDKQDFALRSGSQPPPRTSQTVLGEFPPLEERKLPAVEPVEGPLRLLRYSPEGQVPIAGQVSLTFDRPMVAVSGHDDLGGRPAGIRMQPEIDGQWRWVGTRTLLFEPEQARLPMATEFHVDVSQSIEAADGSQLEKPVSFRFTTPAVEFSSLYPQGEQVGLDPVLILAFNQRISSALLPQFVNIANESGQSLAIGPASDADLATDQRARELVEQLNPGYWLALKTREALPANQRIIVELAANAPSEEGPVRTEALQSKSFRTYPPFTVRETRCGWRSGCAPDDVISLEFSSPLATEQALSERVSIEPEVLGLDIQAWGNGLMIHGLKRGRTTYRVSLDSSLVDQFGQRLDGERDFAFQVGSARPMLSLGVDQLTTLDPSAAPRLEFFSTNYRTLNARIHRVTAADWPAYQQLYRGARWQPDESVELPGEPVFAGSLEIDAERDRPVRTSIDLAPYLGEDHRGHLVARFEPGSVIEGAVRADHSRHELTWIQATNIGIDASADARQLLVWATELDSGQPLKEAQVSFGVFDGRWSSDESGLTEIALPESSELADGVNWILVEHGNDSALLPEANYWSVRTGWVRRDQNDQVLWQVFDDRGIYRPGERVHLKGWLRLAERRPDGGLALLPDSSRIDFAVADALGNLLHEGQAELSALGGFDLAFDLPDTPNLGDASIELTLSSATRLSNTVHVHRFSLQEFRTPEFEVTSRMPAGPFIGNQTVPVEVQAVYYAGGALPGADINWRVSARPGHYAPPNHADWRFGFESPRWFHWAGHHSQTSQSEVHQGTTDGGGKHAIDVSMNFDQQPRPLLVEAAATVFDVNRQAWNAGSEFLVHPGQAYVGLKTDTYFVEQGEPLVLELIATDIEGEVLGDRPVVVEAARAQHVWRGRQLEQEMDEAQRCRVRTGPDGQARCEFDTEIGGQYHLTATIRDDEGRRNASRVIRWVGGGRMPATDAVGIEEVILIPDQDTHQAGDVARLLVQAPFDNAEGLLTLRRHGLAEQRRFTIKGGSTTLEIPLRQDWIPNIQAHVILVGSAERSGSTVDVNVLPPRPAIAVGQHEFSLSTAERVLDVELRLESSSLSPGESTEVDLAVLDADGQPVQGAELALIVVDEAILALTGYSITDPMERFYRPRDPEVIDRHLRPGIRLFSPDAFAESLSSEKQLMFDPSEPMTPLLRIQVTGSRMVAADEVGAAASDSIAVRENFNPLAAFVPALITDAQGRVSARIDLPDNLTRYRLTVVAVDGATRFGKAESNLTSRLPLMVRASPPRFLNFGDVFEFPVVVQNQTDQPSEVHLAMAASNLELTAAAGYAFDVPANDRREVRLPAAALEAGIARYQIATASADFADAARGELPVWTPATTEAFATYGVIDEGAMVQPIVTPDNIWPQFGQLDITTSSTAVQSLTDAFLYLHEYPFHCSEQVASRILAVAALRDVLEAFEVDGIPSSDQIERSMAADMERLAGMQNGDGGFGLWQRGRESWPYATLHVAHALIRARGKGYSVNERLLESTLEHVRHIERYIPSAYADRARRHIVAYALYVRGLHNDFDRVRARALIAEVTDFEALTFESLGWLLGVLSGDKDSSAELDQLRRFLANRVSETAAGAQFVSRFQDGDHLIMHSDRRADGIVLEALMRDQPDSDLIQKLVQGLQAHRIRGRWGNTQDNAFVLLALDQYFRIHEGTEPDFVARTWLGQGFAGEHAFRGRSVDSHNIEIPMAWLARDGGEQDLTLDKDGAGRLYYRIGLNYAPASLDLAAASHGFEVTRIYRSVDDPDDVHQRDGGVWEIKAGARVEVELSLVAPARRYHVALVDPLPAGLESINPALAVSDSAENGNESPINPYARGRGGWWGPWYEHQNLRRERTEAFASLLPGGVYHYSYFARATTPGEFIVPPARAEEMYQPETFGRSASARVIVVDGQSE